MFHKNARSSETSVLSASNQHISTPNHAGLRLVPIPARPEVAYQQAALKPHSPLLDLVVISARRCSSFFAEAAVLVLVFGILDFFMLKGRIDAGWIVGALSISLGLLAASVATDFGAHRWMKAHP